MQAVAASQPFAPATARQRSTTARRHIVAASAGAPQQPGQALERRQLLLGGAALPVFAALGSVRPAQADEFECQPKASPSGIKWCDIAEGFGEPATAGARIRAHYEGRLLDGTVFDSSYSRGPLVFQVGAGQVIKGWDLGILGGEGVPPMKPGGRRRLEIPPALAYGDRGAGGIIKPGATLVFDVTYLGKAQ